MPGLEPGIQGRQGRSECRGLPDQARQWRERRSDAEGGWL